MRFGLDSALEAAKSSSGGGGAPGRYLSYLILGDGETKVVRFLTDQGDIAGIRFHEFIKDKNGKFQNFVYAPDLEDGNTVDWVEKYGGKTTDYTTKEPVESRPRMRIVGIVVEREEVPVDEGGRRVVKTQDKLTEFPDKDGVNHTARNFLVIKQSDRFWNQMAGYHHEYGTICDRDYKITRNGVGTALTFAIVPKSPDPDWNNDGSSLAKLRAQYGYGTGQDMDGNTLTRESADRFLYCRQTLPEWLAEQGSEERAREALAGGAEPALNSPTPAPGWASGAPDEPLADSTPTAEMSSLRARLERHR